MKELSFPTKIYLYVTYVVGIAIFIWHMSRIDLSNPWMLMILCLLASLALIYKVEGATNRSHYTFSFLVYGFTLTMYGIPEAILVIAVSNLAEWIWNRPAWYIQLFNSACYILVMQVAGLVYYWINPDDILVSWQAVLAVVASMTTFNLLNHLMVGVVLWLARGENFKKSGVLDFFPIMLDLTLLFFGASLAFVWKYNYFALVLFAVPVYIIYSTLRVPELERQTEIDNKTGLFNLGYFKKQAGNELSRANRFDRPFAIIMADLDMLRNINNTYGHLAGDEVLIGIAKILKQSVREYDIAARFGGEEFAILLPETTIQKAYERAEFLRKAIEEAEFTVPTNVSPIRATMSFGVACRESFSQTIDEIIHNADTALYHSKLSGRNRAYAYTNDEYINFLNSQDENGASEKSAVENSRFIDNPVIDEGSYKLEQGSLSDAIGSDPAAKFDPKPDSGQLDTSTKPRDSKFIVNIYIGVVALISLVSFAAVYRASTPLQYFLSPSEWISLFVICILIAMSEWFSVNLYYGQTAISTSAIPILAGYLLFGPLGTLVVSLTVAITLFVKYRSPISRFFFNFGNHILAGTLCVSLTLVTGKQFLEWNSLSQILLSLASAAIMYFVTTWSIAIGMSLDLKQPTQQIWKEQYSWLALYYIGFGLIAYTLVFGYKYDKNAGILLMVIPMILLRFSQEQYISRTKKAIIELREKNQILKKNSEEIFDSNEGLLETLSEIIDLRDPYVLGHSKQVSYYATEIAKRMKLNDKQVELIRKGALLHDVGKIGISEDILTKPSRLTPDEYEVIKRHAALGADLVGKSPSLRPLIPIIRHHHEFFNGNGYPDKLRGNQIGIEARIVAIADAIEAMSSDRPYRKALDPLSVINEIRRYAGSQFDPLIVDAAIKMIEFQTGLREVKYEIRSDSSGELIASAPSS
jgi:diguanylate cyclase (GGDEF)-like protein/putative nucleotidyltransferase with HDIG domain